MSSDVRVLTYDELASSLGIGRESARQLVIRKRWTRRKGNDGRARVDVPAEVLEGARTSDRTGDTPYHDTSAHTGDTPYHTPSDTSAHTAAITALTRHIERLEAELAEVRPQLAELIAVKAVLEAEKRRSDELCTERDRSRTYADRLERELAELQPKAAEHDVLAVQVETLKAALEESRRERDKWATTAHALAHPLPPPAPTPRPSRGLLGWLRAARR